MTWRPATPADAAALRDLERAASQAGLAHVFGAVPYPGAAVLARWEATIEEPGVTVLVHEHAFSCWDDTGRLRHLGVHPDHWGQGLARAAVEQAVADGARTLWALAENDRAHGFYAHLGWTPTGRERAAEWAPYPTELELELRGSADG